MNKSDKIYVAGHRGLVGSALMRRLERGGYRNLVSRSHSDLDLTNQYRDLAHSDIGRPDLLPQPGDTRGPHGEQ